MAQKTEKEETEFKVPETLTLCVNNCGFTGNPATNNMCQKCFNATATTTASAVSGSSTSGGGGGGGSGVAIMKFSSEKSLRSRPIIRSGSSDAAGTTGQNQESTDRREKEANVEKRVVNRCSGCRRKVGLTGFRCRCGELFCGEHRYSDRHDCSYDYKSAGRDAIARENPVIKAAKIVRVWKLNLKTRLKGQKFRSIYTHHETKSFRQISSSGIWWSKDRKRVLERELIRFMNCFSFDNL